MSEVAVELEDLEKLIQRLFNAELKLWSHKIVLENIRVSRPESVLRYNDQMRQQYLRVDPLLRNRYRDIESATTSGTRVLAALSKFVRQDPLSQ